MVLYCLDEYQELVWHMVDEIIATEATLREIYPVRSPLQIVSCMTGVLSRIYSTLVLDHSAACYSCFVTHPHLTKTSGSKTHRGVPG